MQILILSARPDTASNRRLVEAARACGLDLDIVDATTVVAAADGGLSCRGHRLDDPLPKAVLARVGNWRPDSILAQLEVLTARGVPTPNAAPAIRVGRDHWRTAQVLARSGLPVPATLSGADPEALAAAVCKRLSFPVVVKQRRSRMGVGVIRCDRRDHLEAVLDSLWRVGDEVAVQQYVETEGCSLRYLVVGSEVAAAARFRAGNGEWRSNSARGGRGEAVPIDAEIAGLAVASASAVGLGVCGVDILPGAGGPIIGELNPTPGFVGVETATGADVAAAIVAHLASLRS